MNKKQFAFTLIELLVVIAIIGILSGLIVVSMNGATEKANIAKFQVFSNSLRNALMINTVSQFNFNDIADVKIGTTPVAADINDSWGSNNGIGIVGNPIIRGGSDCVTGKCIEFNGITETTWPYADDAITIAKVGFPAGEEPVTFEAWVKVKQKFNYSIVIFGKAWFDQSGIGIYGGNFIIGTYGGSTFHPYAYTKISGYTLNKWYHLVGTYSNSVAKICVNADCQTYTGAVGANPNNTSYEIIIGADATTYYHLNGLIDDARLYKEAMPTSQIKEQYYAGLNSLLINGGITKEEYLSRINNMANK
jgi:prepilin-type N-terminal cleavage/methylation domain-containing protein